MTTDPIKAEGWHWAIGIKDHLPCRCEDGRHKPHYWVSLSMLTQLEADLTAARTEADEWKRQFEERSFELGESAEELFAARTAPLAAADQLIADMVECSQQTGGTPESLVKYVERWCKRASLIATTKEATE